MRDFMIDTVIVSGGNIQNGFALDFLEKLWKQQGRENIRLIAADRGLEFLGRAGLLPDQAVGDFDSISREGLSYLEQLPDESVVRLKPEKDDSDTQSAVCLAVQEGAKDIVLLGCLGTRMDHVLANLGLLALGKELGIRITILDEHNYITLVESGTVLKRQEQFGRYVSFFALEGPVEGLILEGFKYTFKKYRLTMRDAGLTVSNEIVGETARISYDTGSLVMVMSRD
jgi:thiamine pyrophosphokinase